jgi:hypothetical protein
MRSVCDERVRVTEHLRISRPTRQLTVPFILRSGCRRHAQKITDLRKYIRLHSKHMVAGKRHTPSTWDLWGARDDAVPFSGNPNEVDLIAHMTGRSAIQVRLAIMKVGPNRDAILEELKKTTA